LPNCKSAAIPAPPIIDPLPKEKVAAIDRTLKTADSNLFLIDTRLKLQENFKSTCCKEFYDSDGGHLIQKGEALVTQILFEKIKAWASSTTEGPFKCTT
jgi:hypothetical protein